MRLVDADYVQGLLRYLRIKYKKKYEEKGISQNSMDFFNIEYDLYVQVYEAQKECTCPTYTVIEAESNAWIKCSEMRPDPGVDVILAFKDTYHKHPSWPKVQTLPAWIGNVGEEETPDGIWVIGGRLGNYHIPLEDGIAWQPMPKYTE